MAEPPKKSRFWLSFFLGCTGVMALGCVGVCGFVALWPDGDRVSGAWPDGDRASGAGDRDRVSGAGDRDRDRVSGAGDRDRVSGAAVVGPDARAAMLGTYTGRYDASGSVAGIAAQEYHDRGTITVTEGPGNTLVFRSVTRQTGDTCTVRASWDGRVARVRPNQRCEGDFADGTTYTGTIESGVARLSGDELVIETSGRISGRRGFFPYVGDYTGTWTCTRDR
jgi:hypothetical protein